jgi:hypothetical protein
MGAIVLQKFEFSLTLCKASADDRKWNERPNPTPDVCSADHPLPLHLRRVPLKRSFSTPLKDMRICCEYGLRFLLKDTFRLCICTRDPLE